MANDLIVVDSSGEPKIADSKEEFWVAAALHYLRKPFYYQVPLFGGRVPGGQILDFVVTEIEPKPIQVYGEHWHTGRLGSWDWLKIALVEQLFKTRVLILWGDELGDKEHTIKVVREKL